MSCRGVVLFQGEQHGRCESASMAGRHLCAYRYEIKQGREYRVATKHRGGLSFGYFSLATQRKVTRHQAKTDLKITRAHYQSTNTYHHFLLLFSANTFRVLPVLLR